VVFLRGDISFMGEGMSEKRYQTKKQTFGCWKILYFML
jgi:hypothetical protein